MKSIKIFSEASELIEDEDNYLEDFDCYGKECMYPYSIKKQMRLDEGLLLIKGYVYSLIQNFKEQSVKK